MVLYDMDSSNAFVNNIAADKPEIVKALFALAVEDAEGEIPDHLLKLADNEQTIPGCSELAAH